MVVIFFKLVTNARKGQLHWTVSAIHSMFLRKRYEHTSETLLHRNKPGHQNLRSCNLVFYCSSDCTHCVPKWHPGRSFVLWTPETRLGRMIMGTRHGIRSLSYCFVFQGPKPWKWHQLLQKVAEYCTVTAVVFSDMALGHSLRNSEIPVNAPSLCLSVVARPNTGTSGLIRKKYQVKILRIGQVLDFVGRIMHEIFTGLQRIRIF